MTYNAREISADQGRPVELYDFSRGYLHWRYTSADRDLSVETYTWTAAAIIRGGIEVTNELNRSAMKLTVPRDHAVADLYRVSPPTEPITCIIRQYHEGDGEIVTVWTGRIIGVEWAGSTAEITLEPVYTSVRRNGLRRRYQKSCPHVLYQNGCRVSRDTYRLDTTADSIAGLVVSAAGVNAHADGYYAGGYIEWEVSSGLYERRFIVNHTGANMELSSAPYGLVLGAQIRVYPGCDHTLATCDSKFNNAANYGGMPFIPQKNPFGGDPVY